MSKNTILIDSASILVIRDNEQSGKLEVLMVRRHEDIAFAGGAYVFPGGKMDAVDLEHKVEVPSFPVGYSELLVTAIREVFEESRLVIGTGDLINALRNGQISFAEFVAQANINRTTNDIIPFARWITPRIYPRRFDTRFFLARAPENQNAVPDGQEVIEAVWAQPLEFIENNRENMMFPTIMNLKLLSHASDVDEAMALAKARKIVPVEPKLVDGVRIIDPSAGYDDVDQRNMHPGVKNKPL